MGVLILECQFCYSESYPVLSDKEADNKDKKGFLPETRRSKITELFHVYK